MNSISSKKGEKRRYIANKRKDEKAIKDLLGVYKQAFELACVHLESATDKSKLEWEQIILMQVKPNKKKGKESRWI